MATYKGIKGVKVESKATDPGDTTAAVGNVWYNTTSFALKYAIAGAGTWAAGGDTIDQHHYPGTAKNSTQSAGLCFAGFDGPTYPSPGVTTGTENYNGTAWTEVGNLLTGRAAPGGAGSQTAAICISGTPYSGGSASRNSLTEIWNGSSWSEVNNVLTASAWMCSFGTNTAAIFAGGSGPGAQDMCQTWDGTCWTEGNNLLVATSNDTGCGTTTAGLHMGSSPVTKASQTYDGNSWTEASDLNSDHSNSAGWGTQTAAMITGSDAPSTTGDTEIYDGTSWTETTNLGTASYGMGGLGTTSLGLIIGGWPSAIQTEEWTNPVYAIKTVTTS